MRSPTGPKRFHLVLVLVVLLLFGDSDGIMAEMESPANGLGLKEQSHIVAQHNRLRNRVTPMAANMQKMPPCTPTPQNTNTELSQLPGSEAGYVPEIKTDQKNQNDGRNERRCGLNTEWNEELAALAEQRASSCQTNASRSPPPPLTGWNTHASARNATSFSQVLQRWFEEGRHYDLQRGRCQENAHCQHYTQMVWATSHQVGCARQVCGREQEQSWDHYVCCYSPGGNWQVNGRSLAPYRAGESCSLCTSSRSGCVRHWDHLGGLCEVPLNACRISCAPHGQLNVSSCRCRCDPGFTGLFCQVRCSVQCVHGRYRKEECSCRCDLGYGGPRCAEKLRFPLRSCSVRIDGDCFMVSPGAETFYAAKTRCQERGGMLAQIHNQKVQDILAFYLGQLEATNHLTNLDFETRNFWIGLTYKSLKDSFRWDTGEPLDFSSFAFGQPDNQGFGNCVEMQVSSGFNWNDQRCKTRNRYICQYAPHHIALWNVGG